MGGIPSGLSWNYLTDPVEVLSSYLVSPTTLSNDFNQCPTFSSTLGGLVILTMKHLKRSIIYFSEIVCPELSWPENGTVTSPNGHAYNAVATYSCYEGLSLQGSASRRCHINGRWDGEEPQCIGEDKIQWWLDMTKWNLVHVHDNNTQAPITGSTILIGNYYVGHPISIWIVVIWLHER